MSQAPWGGAAEREKRRHSTDRGFRNVGRIVVSYGGLSHPDRNDGFRVVRSDPPESFARGRYVDVASSVPELYVGAM